MREKFKLAVLVSGNGSNLEALIDGVKTGIITKGSIDLVISNKENAYALKRAEEAGIKACCVIRKNFASDEEYDKYILAKLNEYEIDVILLAGYLRILTGIILKPYQDKILNIHPSLLPEFGGIGLYGLRVHQEVIKSGSLISGCSVHVVNEKIDGGPIIAQSRVEIMPDDTPDTLSSKVLEQEHKLYPKAVEEFLSNI